MPRAEGDGEIPLRQRYFPFWQRFGAGRGGWGKGAGNHFRILVQANGLQDEALRSRSSLARPLLKNLIAIKSVEAP